MSQTTMTLLFCGLIFPFFFYSHLVTCVGSGTVFYIGKLKYYTTFSFYNDWMGRMLLFCCCRHTAQTFKWSSRDKLCSTVTSDNPVNQSFREISIPTTAWRVRDRWERWLLLQYWFHHWLCIVSCCVSVPLLYFVDIENSADQKLLLLFLFLSEPLWHCPLFFYDRAEAPNRTLFLTGERTQRTFDIINRNTKQ